VGCKLGLGWAKQGTGGCKPGLNWAETDRNWAETGGPELELQTGRLLVLQPGQLGELAQTGTGVAAEAVEGYKFQEIPLAGGFVTETSILLVNESQHPQS